MTNEQLKRMRPDVWATYWSLLSNLHEAEKKIAGYTEHLDMELPLGGLYSDCKKAVELAKKVKIEIEAAKTEQQTYNLVGRAKRHLHRFDMLRTDCCFRVLDSWMAANGKPITGWGSAFNLPY